MTRSDKVVHYDPNKICGQYGNGVATLFSWIAEQSLSDRLAMLGIAITALGFVLAVWQLWRTANATNATRTAILDAVERIDSNHILLLAPQFHTVEEALGRAIDSEDKPLAINNLLAYRNIASQAAGLIGKSKQQEHQSTINRLNETAESASKAKHKLVSRSSATVRLTLKDVYPDICAVASEMTILGVTISSKTE